MIKSSCIILWFLAVLCLTANQNEAEALGEGIWANPQSFDVNLIEGTGLTENMAIGNNGTTAFDYEIRSRCHYISPVYTNTLEKTAAASKKQDILRSPKKRDFTGVENASYKEGELLVRFAGEFSDGQAGIQSKNEILKSVGGGIIKKNFKTVPGLSLVGLPAGLDVKSALKKFNKSLGILYAQPNYKMQVLSTIPNDPMFGELWGMNNTGQAGGLADADIDAPEAWSLYTGSRDFIVAVVDTGVDRNHPDLVDNMWINAMEKTGTPGIDDDGNGYIDDIYGWDVVGATIENPVPDGDPLDSMFHGTHLAGTIGAATNNAIGIAGINWEIKIMAIKIFDDNEPASGTYNDIEITGIEYALINGARIVNFGCGGYGYSQALYDIIAEAKDRGVLVVASAGNESNNNDGAFPLYPASYDLDNIISAAATDRFDHLAQFSNYGWDSVDLGAPGVAIFGTFPTYNTNSMLDWGYSKNYETVNGTSMAASYVSGACALIWSMNPMLNYSDIKDIILEKSDRKPDLSGRCVSGGRLNIYKALIKTKAPGIAFEPQSGIAEPNKTDNITVTFDANGLDPGIYWSEIRILSNDPAHSEISIPATLTVKSDALKVEPLGDFASQGKKWGPFVPNCAQYIIINSGEKEISWKVTSDVNWLTIIPAAGDLEPNETVDVNICLTESVSQFNPNIYIGKIKFENVNTGSVKRRNTILAISPPDCFTKYFNGTSQWLRNIRLTLTPNGSNAYYEACRDTITAFQTEPNGGIYVALSDDDSNEIVLGGGKQVLFYGIWYDRFYVGSNGYITFGQPDTEKAGTLINHFSLPRISALFTNLDPSSGSSISYKQLDDRIAVTFKDVPLYGKPTSKNSFQIEMFFASGLIKISWLNIASSVAVAGLSEGKEMPMALFKESNFNSYLPCRPTGDLNRDYVVNFKDVALFALSWRNSDCSIPYWCGKRDFNWDQKVDESDLEILSDNWLVDYWMLLPQ